MFFLVFSKKDLCDEELLMPFIRHYEEKGYIVLPFDIAKKDSFAELCERKKLSTIPKKEVRNYCVFDICSVTLLQTY